uniref:Uncharacterized protein n=1 Tax=Anguilla anguilla TaxID=7936 RepID=A0A0E9VY28_ANGAN
MRENCREIKTKRI